MKSVGGFAVFLLFLAGIAIFNLRNMAERHAEALEVPAAAELGAFSWRLRQVTGESLSMATAVELRLAADGTLALQGACNRYQGTYEYDAGRIVVGKLAGTRRACPEGIMATDAAVVGLLQRARDLRRAGRRLLFYDETGVALGSFLSPVTAEEGVPE